MEQQLVEWLAKTFPPRRPVVLGIGDDAAVLDANQQQIVFSTDTICDEVHFQSGSLSPQEIGRKALAVNLSDLAAMGAMPLAAVVAVTLPESRDLNYAKNLLRGMKPLADRYQICICGGDTAVWPGRLVVTVSVVGAVPKSGAWRLNAARANDLIVVTGKFGGSIARHHLEFEPRCEFAQAWVDKNIIRAATDASDSLSLDLQKMAVAGGVGFELHTEKIPVSQAAHEIAKNSPIQWTAIDHALFDGEDFELILAVDPIKIESLMQWNKDPKLTIIGKFISDQSYWLVSNGQRMGFEPKGFRHRFS